VNRDRTSACIPDTIRTFSPSWISRGVSAMLSIDVGVSGRFKPVSGSKVFMGESVVVLADEE